MAEILLHHFPRRPTDDFGSCGWAGIGDEMINTFAWLVQVAIPLLHSL